VPFFKELHAPKVLELSKPESVLSDTKNENLEFPDYSDQATRLQSFKYWGGVLPKEELADAGFYMIACRDVVRCFSCHVVLQDWERTDNVIDEHQRHSPNCKFLKLSHDGSNLVSARSPQGNPSSNLAIKQRHGVLQLSGDDVSRNIDVGEEYQLSTLSKQIVSCGIRICLSDYILCMSFLHVVMPGLLREKD